jgi:hypothetical protein
LYPAAVQLMLGGGWVVDGRRLLLPPGHGMPGSNP